MKENKRMVPVTLELTDEEHSALVEVAVATFLHTVTRKATQRKAARRAKVAKK